MDSLIRERNGVEEIWYSQEYLIQQMELAYRAGLHRGIRVEIHAMQPMDDKAVDDLTDVFQQRLEDEYREAQSKGEVWRIKKQKE